jgi:predicted nucleic acid-binding Zn ribbon protein
MDDLDNLITLCASCHKKIEYGIDPVMKQRYLAELMSPHTYLQNQRESETRELAASGKLCQVCSKPFRPKGNQKVCSLDCLKESARIKRRLEKRTTHRFQTAPGSTSVCLPDPGQYLMEVYERYEYLDAPLSGHATTETAKIACELWQAVKRWKRAVGR